MSRARMHYLDRVSDGTHALMFSLCGMQVPHEGATRDMASVTCKLCTDALREPVIAEAQYPRATPYDMSRHGCRTEVRIRAEFSEDRPLHKTWQSALLRLIQTRDDGASIKSTSDPARFDGHSPSGENPGGDRAQRVAAEMAAVARSLEQAYATPYVLSDVPRRTLSAAACQSILELHVAGKPWRTEGKRAITRRVPWERQELPTAVATSVGFDVTEGDVQRVVFHGARRIEQDLFSRGLLAHRDARLLQGQGAGDDMADTVKKPWDYDSVAQIADALQQSQTTIRRWMNLKADPLPTRTIPLLGKTVAIKSEIEEWLRRNVKAA